MLSPLWPKLHLYKLERNSLVIFGRFNSNLQCSTLRTFHSIEYKLLLFHKNITRISATTCWDLLFVLFTSDVAHMTSRVDELESERQKLLAENIKVTEDSHSLVTYSFFTFYSHFFYHLTFFCFHSNLPTLSPRLFQWRTPSSTVCPSFWRAFPEYLFS